MSVWRKARKKPIIVEFREPIDEIEARIDTEWVPCERIDTLEGQLYAVVGRDYIIRGVKGELYPIKKEIFEETYEEVSEEG